MANESDFQDFSTVQSGLQPKPVTIASTTTVAPKGFLTFISGTTAIATVTPPLAGVHLLVFIFTTTTPVAFTTTGNIKTVATPTANIPMFLVYNPIDAKYYVGEVTA
jgi:hypothetical protein